MKDPLLSFLLLFAVLLAACNDEPDAGKSDVQKLSEAEQLQNTFTKPIVSLPRSDTGDSMLFGVKNCHVYRASQSQDSPPDWELLFKPASYALPKMCIVERLEMEDEYLQIEIGTQAIGAGGCCTTYAAYRSVDGETWEIRPATSIESWRPLEQ